MLTACKVCVYILMPLNSRTSSDSAFESRRSMRTGPGDVNPGEHANVDQVDVAAVVGDAGAAKCSMRAGACRRAAGWPPGQVHRYRGLPCHAIARCRCRRRPPTAEPCAPVLDGASACHGDEDLGKHADIDHVEVAAVAADADPPPVQARPRCCGGRQAYAGLIATRACSAPAGQLLDVGQLQRATRAASSAPSAHDHHQGECIGIAHYWARRAPDAAAVAGRVGLTYYFFRFPSSRQLVTSGFGFFYTNPGRPSRRPGGHHGIERMHALGWSCLSGALLSVRASAASGQRRRTGHLVRVAPTCDFSKLMRRF